MSDGSASPAGVTCQSQDTDKNVRPWRRRYVNVGAGSSGDWPRPSRQRDDLPEVGAKTGGDGRAVILEPILNY